MTNPQPKQAGQTAHTPGPLSFDGCGINGGDEYKSRIATFAKIRGDDAMHYGPLFAAAPELLAACKALLAHLPYGNEALQIKAQAAIAKATGS